MSLSNEVLYFYAPGNKAFLMSAGSINEGRAHVYREHGVSRHGLDVLTEPKILNDLAIIHAHDIMDSCKVLADIMMSKKAENEDVMDDVVDMLTKVASAVSSASVSGGSTLAQDNKDVFDNFLSAVAGVFADVNDAEGRQLKDRVFM